jgi:hypothetical protein
VKKSRFTEEQIAFAMKQAETGTPVAEVIRRMGISERKRSVRAASRYWRSGSMMCGWQTIAGKCPLRI